MVKLVKALAKADADYRRQGEVDGRLARRSRRSPSGSGPTPKDVPAAMKLYTLPDAAGAGVADLARRRQGRRRARRWPTPPTPKEQGRIKEVKPDYTTFVTTNYVAGGANRAEVSRRHPRSAP